jgi:N-acetylglucosamine-6-phosphate deacetylase
VKSAGLVDLQVNGFGGIDFNAGAFETGQIAQAMEALLATGVTTLLPTLITATEAALRQRFVALDAAIAADPLARLMCPGYHLEGPFLNPAPGYAGCHPADAMIAPDYAMVRRLERDLARPILLITLAPELPGAEDFIRAARADGKLVAIGHSAAGFEDVTRAVAAGAAMSTHLGNGLPQQMHKLVNPLFAQLAEDALVASVIADGIHIHRASLKVLLRAKGPGRSILVTDAVAGAAAAPGFYPFAGMQVERGADGSVRLPGGTTLAGSALCLDAAMRNLLAWGIADAPEALAMAASRPAALLAPALAAHGLQPVPGDALWSEDLWLRHISVGPFERRYPAANQPMENDHAG